MYTHTYDVKHLRCNLELVICTYKLLFSYKTALKNQGHSGVQVIWLQQPTVQMFFECG